MEEINASIDFDCKLAAQDIMASQAHIAMLAAKGVVEAADVEAILKSLAQVKGEIEAGTFRSSARSPGGSNLSPRGDEERRAAHRQGGVWRA
jgi:argininosuccinate lyase